MKINYISETTRTQAVCLSNKPVTKSNRNNATLIAEQEICHKKKNNFNISQNSLLEYEKLKIPLEASTGPEGSRSLRLPDFKTIGT
jgi:hypothetical protein